MSAGDVGRERVERPFHLRLIHFNDLHGRLAEVGPEAVRPVFSRIAGFIRRAREEAAGKPDSGVLVLSGGDDLVGSPFGELAGWRPEQFRCHPAYRLYSAAGVDAAVVGNHDLDWGLRMLAAAAAQDARFPLLSANLVLGPNAEVPGLRAASVLDVNGLRVGIIGVTTQAEVKRLVPGEFEIADPVAAVLNLLPVVQAQSDVTILLSHLGRSASDSYPPPRGIRDAELALAMPRGALPLIIGSHTHTVLNEGGLDPANVVNGILLAQAGSNGRFVGDILLQVDSGGARVDSARLWPVESLPEEPSFEETYVLPLAQSVQRLLAAPVGRVTSDEDLDPIRVRESFAARESALANYVTDALAARCRAAGLPVDFVMLDSPGLSGGLPQHGTLTFGDLFALSPHADSIVLARLPVRALQAFLDDNARRLDLPGEPREERGFVQFSREVRCRIEGVQTGRRSSLRAAGVTLDGMTPDQWALSRGSELKVAFSSFCREFSAPWEENVRARGLLVFDVRTLPCRVTHLALREELVAYAREMGGVTRAAGLARDGRLTFASS